MLYDINIPWSPSTSAAELERTLRFSSQLGYNVVALNHTLQAPLSSQISNPLPKFPPLPSTNASASASSSSQDASRRMPTVLHRATICFSDPAHNQHMTKAAQTFDILATRPQTEKAFQAACVTVQEASIISLDLTVRLPFYLRPKPCMAAVNRGVRFEICYGRALGSSDARARANLAGNVAQLVRATRGRGLVLGSEAPGPAALRAPADLLNLLAVWGLPADRGRDALGSVPRALVANEAVKRSGFRGVVDIVGLADRPPGEEQQEKGQQTKGSSQTAATNNSKKRKNGEGVAADGGGEGGETQPMSKRQAKKLKAALRKKEAEDKKA
ncbi:PHP domain-like protein [Hypoxylon sp. FL1284]|nr:PHP domain-like protein [Hypoxylon sp. FL1284]